MRAVQDRIGDARPQDPVRLALAMRTEDHEVGAGGQRAKHDAIGRVASLDDRARDAAPTERSRRAEESFVRRLTSDRDRLTFREHVKKGDLDVARKRKAREKIDGEITFRGAVDGRENPSRRSPELPHHEKGYRRAARERSTGASKDHAPDRPEAAGSDDHELLGPLERGSLDGQSDRPIADENACWDRACREVRRRLPRKVARGLAELRIRRYRLRGAALRCPHERVVRNAEHRHVIGDGKGQREEKAERPVRSRRSVRRKERTHVTDRRSGARPSLSGPAPPRARGAPDGTIGPFSGAPRLTTRAPEPPSLDLVSTAAMILRAQEKERARVARELHDDTGQALTLLLVRLQLLTDQMTDPRTQAELTEIRALVAQTIDGVRRLAVDLGPTVLDDLGLSPSIEWLAQRIRTDGAMRIGLHLDVDREPPRPVALAMFRVAQEALTNVVRHARASCVSIRLTSDGSHLRLVVADDGVGFDVKEAERRDADCVGLLGMTERIALVGGRLTIDSGRTGTTVVADVPVAGDVP